MGTVIKMPTRTGEVSGNPRPRPTLEFSGATEEMLEEVDESATVLMFPEFSEAGLKTPYML